MNWGTTGKLTNGFLWSTSLSGFWQVDGDGTFDPPIPNLTLETPADNGIEIVGYVTGTANGAIITLDLTNLTGGIASRPRKDDIVIFAQSNRNNVGDEDPGTTTPGYTEVADLFANGTQDTNLSVSWKRMDATPDSSVDSNSVTGRNQCIAYVVRGIDPTTALDVAVVTATNTSSGIADPSSITPSTANSLVLAIGAGISVNTTVPTAPSGYSNAVTVLNVSPSNHPYIGIASKVWTSGAEDPPAWTGVSDSANYSSASVTIALRPRSTVANAYSITADSISYSWTGTAAFPKRGRLVVAASATYAVSGTAANLKDNKRVVADPTSFAVSGTAAFFPSSKRVIATLATLTVNATAATLRRTFKVAADAATYSIAATAAGTNLGRKLPALSATYSVSGTAAFFLRGYRVIANTISFSITGTPAGLIYSGGVKILVADPRTLTVSATAANLKFSRQVVAGSASFSVIGTAANLAKAGGTITLDTIAFTLGAQATNAFQGRKTIAAPATFIVSGGDANLLETRYLIADNGDVFAVEQLVVLRRGGRATVAQSATFSVNATAAALKRGKSVIATGATFTAPGTIAFFKRNRRVIATGTTFSVNEAALLFKRNRRPIINGTSYQINSPPLNLYILPVKTNDVTKIYGKGRGKKRFWRHIAARDARDKYNLD